MFFAVTSYINGIASLAVAVFVYLKKRDTHLGRLFLALTLSVGLWSILLANVVVSPNIYHAVWWAKIEHVAVALIPVFSLHLGLAVIRLDAQRKTLLFAAYIFSGLLILSLPTGLFEDGVQENIAGLRYYIKPGPLYFAYFLFYVACFVYVELCLLKVYLSERHTRFGHQALFVFLASVLGSGAGSVTFLPVFGFNIAPGLNCLVILYVIALAYAILKYGLLDITVIVKKTLVFAGLLASVFAIVVLPTLLIQEYIFRNTGISGRMLGVTISGVLLIVAMRKIENFLITVTDKYLFQKKYDPTKLIKTFTDEVITLTDLNKLARTTITTLVNTLNIESSAILLSNKNEDKYEMRDFYGVPNPAVSYEANSPFSKYISKSGAPLVLSEKLPSYIRDEMKRVNAAVVLPLILHKQMIGMITLGKKKSDQDYTEEDLDILMALAKAEAIALSNARLFSEAKQNVKLAAIGALAAGINHEVCNPLNRMMSAMQIFLKSKDMGLYRNKSEKELVKMSEDIMKNTMNDIRKIANITRKLSDFARPGREVVTEKVNIAITLRDTMDVLGHEIELKRITFDENIQGPLFTMADRDQLQEIFFNIIRNAIQATGENGRISFSAEKKNGKIQLRIADTGSGIPEDKLDKIFNPFYSTKEKGEGTGLGLAIVRQLVYRNRGDIHVESQVGKGTTFTLEFPEAKNG